MSQILHALVEERLERLCQLSRADLAALPPVSSETVRKVVVTTYRDELPNEQLRVVVQSSLPRFFGLFTSFAVDGIIVSANDEFTKAPDEMMWEF